jgi:two-component system, OmpR family, response regulator
MAWLASAGIPRRRSPLPQPQIRSLMKILVVEDDEETRKYLASGLATEGFAVDCAANGRDALFLASGSPYDLIVVDRMLPGMDGLSLVKVLRGASVSVPVLFLTALDGIDERVAGLNAGGDDYLVKPFAFSEFTARVRALLRRPPLSDQELVLRVADLVLDRTSREVTRQGQRIDLQPREYLLLEYLMRHSGEIVTRTMLLEHVWDFHFDPRTSVVETHISRLRTKIDKPFELKLIKTVRGAGYSINDHR